MNRTRYESVASNVVPAAKRARDLLWSKCESAKDRFDRGYYLGVLHTLEHMDDDEWVEGIVNPATTKDAE